MNELQIEYFLAVTENLSFTKTANELFVSQPAISKQIALLEEELGVKLFERGRKSTQITEAGKLFADYFRKHNAELKSITLLAQNIQTQGRLPLRIATGSSWTLENILESSTALILEIFPHAHLTIENFHFNELADILIENHADVIIGMSHSIKPSSTIQSRHFCNIQRLIAYSNRHPLASKQNLSPLDFKDEIFFFPSLNEKSFIKNLIKSCVEPYGFIPKVQAVPNDQSMISCIINGFGVGIIDTWMFSSRRENLQVFSLDTSHSVSIAWKKENANPVLAMFLKSIIPD